MTGCGYFCQLSSTSALGIRWTSGQGSLSIESLDLSMPWTNLGQPWTDFYRCRSEPGQDLDNPGHRLKKQLKP